ncbi:ABC transporter permease [Halomarina halobia]|uniref:ABC transporter permease n=1 Tax=Halomarina halobia TaxID=3033386 RepID=A0ABD6A7M6_9EURY|nr:ABC transporter permease [Halomarina sp. PSR21]
MTRDAPPETDGGVATAHEAPPEAADASVGGLGRQVAAVARLEYRLSIRSRWAFALTALFGLLAVSIVGFGGSSLGPVRADAVIVSLASLATYLLPLAALVYGFDAVVGSEEAGWLDIVFALPIPRERVVVGTYLGRAVTLAGATAIGFGLGGAALFVRAGGIAPSLYATFLLGAIALGLSFLAIGVLVSTLAAERTRALGAALLVWVWFVFGHDLAALGLVAGVDLPDPVLSALVLSDPAAVFRVLVLSGVDSTGGGLAAVVANTTLSGPALALAALAWVVAPVAVAAVAIRWRGF